MFSHMTIGTSDLPRAKAFYDAVLAPLGIERITSKFPNWGHGIVLANRRDFG